MRFLPGLRTAASPVRSSRHNTVPAVARRTAAGLVVAAAAIAVGGFGALVVAQPAYAATAEADIETKMGDGPIQGKAGAKAGVGFQVINHGKVDVAVTVTIQVPSNAEIDSAGSCTIAGNRRAASCAVPAMRAGSTINGSFQVVLRTAGDGDGVVGAKLSPNQKVSDPKPGNDAARFKLRISGASASPSPSKSTKASRSASAEPTGSVSDEVIAPPEAGNGAIPREEPKTPVSNSKGGLSFGFWIGVVAIVAALGLVGSLFYFRRKDRLEPDTGVFHLPNAGQDSATSVITPGVYGSPAAPAAATGPGFENGPGHGQSYGQGFPPGPGTPGGPNVYGTPAAAPAFVPAAAPPPPAFPPPAFPPPAFPPTAFPPPAFPPPAAPPADAPPAAAPPASDAPASAPPAAQPPVGPPAVSSPGANDQTVLMRRPDDL